MRGLQLATALVLTGMATPPLLAGPVEDYEALREEIWQATLDTSPMLATSVGDRRGDGKLGDQSLAAFDRSVAEAKAFLARYDARLTEARSKLAKHQGEQVSIVRWNPKGPSYMHGGTFASSVVTEMGLARPAHQIGDKSPHSPALSLESLNLLDGDWLVIGTLSTSGEAVEALQQAEQTPAFKQLSAIQGKRFGAVDGSLWTSLGGPQAALQVIADIEQLLGKADAQPLKN